MIARKDLLSACISVLSTSSLVRLEVWGPQGLCLRAWTSFRSSIVCGGPPLLNTGHDELLVAHAWIPRKNDAFSTASHSTMVGAGPQLPGKHPSGVH